MIGSQVFAFKITQELGNEGIPLILAPLVRLELTLDGFLNPLTVPSRPRELTADEVLVSICSISQPVNAIFRSRDAQSLRDLA
ncbi:MAG: hypothetical protein Q4F10_05820 [Corynebacterium glutamicum]|nr:hypothetical protein [Corynebacterium glutamicum]